MSSKMVQLVCLENVVSEVVKWLLEPFIALGKITILDGDTGKGKGKGWFTYWLAALVSSGGTLVTGEHVEKGKVLIISIEDGVADTIKPRLVKLGGDHLNIAVINSPIDLSVAVYAERFGELVAEYGRTLIIIDPLIGAMGGRVDIHRANEVRVIMNRLSKIAEQCNCAIVGVRHLSRSDSSKGKTERQNDCGTI